MENELGNLSHKMIMQSLDWAYDKAVNGVKGLDSAEELAKDYLTQDGSLLDQINALIRWQNAKAGTSGFVTGLGGFLTIPITLPVNITSVLYLQLRMIAAIAIMCGYDVKNDKVKTLAYSCLVATSSVEIVKNLGIKIGEKVAVSALKKIPGTKRPRTTTINCLTEIYRSEPIIIFFNILIVILVTIRIFAADYRIKPD